jgi:hypothetical protein
MALRMENLPAGIPLHDGWVVVEEERRWRRRGGGGCRGDSERKVFLQALLKRGTSFKRYFCVLPRVSSL